MVTYDSFEAARDAAPDGYVVSGAYKEPAEGEEFGDPVYFHAPANASRHVMGMLAFHARTGSPHPDPQYIAWLEGMAADQ